MEMWSAIKSDLLDFVSTIQEDTTKTLSKVLGEGEEDDESTAMIEKMAKDVRRSFETYGTDIKEANAKEFGRFRKTFSLSAYANDIGFVLDEEPEVSRFYAELVPAELTPEVFWARLFFRLNMVYRKGSSSGVLGEDEDDEEELVWDAEVEADGAASTPVAPADNTTEPPGTPNSKSAIDLATSVSGSDLAALAAANKRVAELSAENGALKEQVRALVRRVSDLEAQLSAAEKTESVSRSISVGPQHSDSKKSKGDPVNTCSEVVQPAVSSVAADAGTDLSPDGPVGAYDNSSTSSRGSNVSGNSGNSGVVLTVNGSDTMSFPDDDLSRHGAPPTSSGDAIKSASKSKTSSSGGVASKTTEKFLAAVDDDEEADEEGWD